MNNTNNLFIRSVIAQAAHPSAPYEYALKRWGADLADSVKKSMVAAMDAGADASGPLTAGTLSRQRFVQAVFSRSILGQMRGLVQVPAVCRVNFETAPISAKFVGEHGATPAYQGAFGVSLTDKRKLGLCTVLSRELFRATGDAVEQVIEAQLLRALSRGLDEYFVGTQARDQIAPAGLSSTASQVSVSGVDRTNADSLKVAFNEGVDAYSGDLSVASLLVNPRTAIKMRSAAENGVTAVGGQYGGLGAVASYSVPEDKLFIVDASRVLAYIGYANLSVADHGALLNVDDGAGNNSGVFIDLFSSEHVALQMIQWADWAFVPDAAVEVTLQ